LNDILAVHHRSGHARAVTVQARPDLSDRFRECQVAGRERTEERVSMTLVEGMIRGGWLSPGR
jgi:hypothetical protein